MYPPEVAALFKASLGWQQRFKRRYSIVTRKKTNVKNTTWDESEPKLQAYFRAFRRRLRDATWWEQRAAARQATIAAARTAAPAVAADASVEPVQTLPVATSGSADIPVGNDEPALSETADGDTPSSPPAPATPEHEEPNAAPNAAPTSSGGSTADGREEPRRSPRKRARDSELTAAAEEPDVPWFKRGRGKWGKYLPHQRGNVDQVPLPFICDMDYTLEEKGAKRVAINQLGPSLSKRQMTGQVCLRAEPPPPPPPSASEATKKQYKDNLMEQPPPCLVMRGTGARISQEELDAYPPELVVLWQPKAWVDRPIAVSWVEKCWKKLVAADRAAGVADDTSRYVMIQDNLDAQDAARNPPYIAALDACQTDDHKVTPDPSVTPHRLRSRSPARSSSSFAPPHHSSHSGALGQDR